MARLINVLFSLLLLAFVIEFSLNLNMSLIPGFSLKNIAMYSLLLVMLVANPAMNKPLISRNRVNIPIILFLVYGLATVFMAALLHTVPNYSLGGELILFKSYMDPYVLFVVVCSAVHDEKSINNLLFALIGVLLIFLGITLLSSFGLISVGRVTVDERWGRTTGAFSEPNQFAAYVVMFVPLLAAFFQRTQSKMMEGFYVLSIIAAIYVVLMTGSRGGIVALVVAVGAYYLLSTKERFAKSLMKLVGVYAGLLLVLIVISFLLPAETVDGLISKITGDFENEVATDYSSGRFTIWGLALERFLQSPLFGTGWNTFVRLFGGNSHNDYVLFLVTTGIIGFSLYLLVYTRLLTSAMQFRRNSTANQSLYNAYIAGLVSVLVAMMFVNIYNPSYFILMYSALIIKLGGVEEKDGGTQAVKSGAHAMSAVGGIRRRKIAPVLGKVR